MKKANYIAVVIVAILMAWSSAYGGRKKSLVAIDGNDWLANPESWNLGFVVGFGASITLLTIEAEVKNVVIDFTDIKPGIKDVIKFPIEDWKLDDIIPGHLFDGINTFYKDYRNRNIRVINAIYIVRGEIRGEDPGYIEAWTRWLRKPQKERNKALEEWMKKGLKGPKYKANNGKVYIFRDLVPFE